MSHGIGVMLLCEVAVRPFFEQNHANYHADNDCKKAQALYVAFLSLFCALGRQQTGPRPSENRRHQPQLRILEFSRVFGSLLTPIMT